jgi:hypothetical protein
VYGRIRSQYWKLLVCYIFQIKYPLPVPTAGISSQPEAPLVPALPPPVPVLYQPPPGLQFPPAPPWNSHFFNPFDHSRNRWETCLIYLQMTASPVIYFVIFLWKFLSYRNSTFILNINVRVILALR